jgi:hypothetical protein
MRKQINGTYVIANEQGEPGASSQFLRRLHRVSKLVTTAKKEVAAMRKDARRMLPNLTEKDLGTWWYLSIGTKQANRDFVRVLKALDGSTRQGV